MRLVGDMSWALAKGWELSDLISYEHGFNNSLAHEFLIVSLC